MPLSGIYFSNRIFGGIVKVLYCKKKQTVFRAVLGLQKDEEKLDFPYTFSPPAVSHLVNILY